MTWLEIDVIIPKYDNMKNPVAPEKLEEYITTLARHISYVAGNKLDGEFIVAFSAIPDYYGCWAKEDLVREGENVVPRKEVKFMCDENLKVTIDVPVGDEKDVDETINKINDEIKKITKKFAVELKQESMMFTNSIKRVDFIEGIPPLPETVSKEKREKYYTIDENVKRKSKFVWHRHEEED